MNIAELTHLDQQYYLEVFRRFPLAFVKGEGSKLWDADGKEYIDLLAGIAVNNVGNCHPAVTKAIAEQAKTLMHISNFFVSEPQVLLSQKLVALSGLERVFMTNSGTESIEGAIKLARKFGEKNGKKGTIITFEGAFHGRSLGALAATGKPQMLNGFGPRLEGFRQAKFNDLESVKALLDDSVAGILIEPLQGEGGINVGDFTFLHQLRLLCDEHNMALIFDEIQCGIGRTGSMFCFQEVGLLPDIVTLAKGLGGGFPVGAILCRQKISDALNFGDHGTTFGGNPLASASALATLEVIETENLLAETKRKGQWVKDEVTTWRKEMPQAVHEIRGLGLMLGIVCSFETKPLVAELLSRGVVANATAGNVIRLVPPLNIPDADLQKGLSIIKEVIAVDSSTPNYSPPS